MLLDATFVTDAKIFADAKIYADSKIFTDAKIFIHAASISATGRSWQRSYFPGLGPYSEKVDATKPAFAGFTIYYLHVARFIYAARI